MFYNSKVYQSFKMLRSLITTNWGLHPQRTMVVAANLWGRNLYNQMLFSKANIYLHLCCQSHLELINCGLQLQWTVTAGICFYDFSHVVTKGHNNNLWQPAAPIVTLIVIKNGAVCGHLGAQSICLCIGGGAGREERWQCVWEGRGDSSA